MSTNFPTGLDAPNNPSSADSLDTVGVLHADQHANTNDAIKALEAKVGVNSSAVATSLDYKITNHLAAANPHTVYQLKSDKNAASGYPGLDGSSLISVAQIPSLPESRITNLTTDLATITTNVATNTTTLAQTVRLTGNQTVAGNKTYSGTATFSSTISVTGAATFSSSISVGTTSAFTGAATFTGQILTQDGSAANPSVAFNTGGGVTGFYRVSAGVIGVSSSGTNTFQLSSSALTFSDAINMAFNTTTGTKIGTATTQKLSFWNATPVVRPSAYTQTYATADRTLSFLSATSLTAASGTSDGTVADVGASFSQTTLNNNFKDVSTAINNLVTDHADLAQLVNSILDDLQSIGLLA